MTLEQLTIQQYTSQFGNLVKSTMQKVLVIFFLAGLCLAEIEIPNNLNDVQDIPIIKERCQKKGSPDTYDRIKQAAKDTKTCLESKINPDQVKSELDEAKKTGSMDEVFGKYCKKRPEIKECLMKTVNVSKECLEENEKTALDNAITIIDEVLDFACFRDGDRLAMFVAEGGMECISTRKDQIKDCINATLKINVSDLSLTSLPTNLPSLGIDKKKCDDFAKVQECVVTDLENNCEDTTPSNIVDALFKFVKKTTCKNIKQRRSIRNPTALFGINYQFKKLLDVGTVKEMLEAQCKKNGGENASKNVWTEIDKTNRCLVNIKYLSTPKDEFITGFKNCSKNIAPVVETCLPNEAKYYPEFFLETIVSFIEFAYNHANMLKISSDNPIINCMQRLKYAKAEEKIADCVPKNKTLTANMSPKIEICLKISEYIRCLTNVVTQTCTRDIIIDQFLADARNSIEKPCT